jgi:mono/diheme cytochrome c family protein
VEQGAYLAEALAHCGECHTPRNLGFALNNHKKLAAHGRRVGPSTSVRTKATGLGAWSDDEIFSYLSIGHAEGHGTASGPMGEAVDHSFSQLAPEDIRAVVAYCARCPQSRLRICRRRWRLRRRLRTKMASARRTRAEKWCSKAPASVATAGPARVRSRPSPFTGAWAVNDPNATNVAQIVISGTRRYTPQDAVSMPAFGSVYSDAEIAAVANYVTARFGSKASRITGSRLRIRISRHQKSLLPDRNSLFFEIFSLLICLGNCLRSRCVTAASCYEISSHIPKIAKFPVKFPVSREIAWRRVRIPLRRQPAMRGPFRALGEAVLGNCRAEDLLFPCA